MWDDIVGHELAKHILRSHVEAGRVANAYLLAGPDGVGKRRLALTMARALNCAGATSRPCDECQACRQIALDLKYRGTGANLESIGKTLELFKSVCGDTIIQHPERRSQIPLECRNH